MVSMSYLPLIVMKTLASVRAPYCGSSCRTDCWLAAYFPKNDQSFVDENPN